MIYIYSHSMTPRLKYTLHVCFQSILQEKISYVDRESFEKLGEVPKINYSDSDIPHTLQIVPHALLFEKTIALQEIIITHKKGIPYFFQTARAGIFLHDLFACSFFMVSRYEEYLPFTADVHGRFSAKESIAFKGNFLHLPVVHLWMLEIKKALQKSYPNYDFKSTKYHQINTIDVDIAYAFRGKPFLRKAASLVKSIVRGNTLDLKNRWNFLVKGIDPYDTYAYLESIIHRYHTPTLFFIALGGFGSFDKNIPLNKDFKSLLKYLSKLGILAIHPSYASHLKKDEVSRLIHLLAQETHTKITKSRQHFLRLTFPETYEILIANEIEMDYTMGYADQVGFRAGMCVAYPFFNMLMDAQRPLQIMPFQIMEGTLKDYNKMTPDEAIEQIKQIKDVVKQVNGTFVSIFHNSSLNEDALWKGWRKVYESMF